jgi:hypothetical protein
MDEHVIVDVDGSYLGRHLGRDGNDTSINEGVVSILEVAGV